jgi:hypothetical protein
MLQKSIDKGGPVEYQYQVRDRSFKYVKNKQVAIDVGANVGLWSRSLCKNFTTVMAFEPVSMFRECLVRNVPAANLEIMDFALGNENTTALANGNSIDHKAFEEWGAAVRAGFLATPDVLIFGKAGYVNGEQRKRIEGPVGNTLVYDHYRADGYQVGGGVEFSLTQGRLPVYASAQYVYSNYHGNSSRQRVMGGIGIRFK